MTTATTTHSTATRRRPASVLVAAILLGLIAAAGGYGAIYFTGLEGWDAAGVTFVTTYEAIVVFALASAVALLRGSSHGRVGLVAWGIFMVGFTIMKVVTIQELQAIPFGVVGLVVLGLALHPATKRWAP